MLVLIQTQRNNYPLHRLGDTGFQSLGRMNRNLTVVLFKYTIFSSGSFCQIYRVTDEALIAETAVWPNFFLMNVFFAFDGSKRYIIIWSNSYFILY